MIRMEMQIEFLRGMATGAFDKQKATEFIRRLNQIENTIEEKQATNTKEGK